jgi:hypothetical protein
MKFKCKQFIAAMLLVIALTLGSFTGCHDNSANSQGEELFEQAQSYESQNNFNQAAELYKLALPLLLEDNRLELANKCSEAAERLTLFRMIYPYTSEQMKTVLTETYPQVSSVQIDDWIKSGDLEHYSWDGCDHYFEDAASNLIYSNLELMHADAVKQKSYQDLVLNIIASAEEEVTADWQQYQKPVTYLGTHKVSIPRAELPATGIYHLWFPLPINNGPQTQVVIESISPDIYVKQPPSIDQNIGLLYMEVPLEKLQEDLNIQVKFTFTHFEQRFTVDPDNIGEYDKQSLLYQKYTLSNGNTEITPEIRETAQNIAGDEKNPYIVARKLYDYIVNNIDYAFMPHLVMWPRTSQTESDYVQKNQRGDCGAQSMYFTAMCRSLGIPARTTGGWQLFSGNFSGHFWAEFYLPYYGWIPVDTSAAQLCFYPKDLTAGQRQIFIDYTSPTGFHALCGTK